MTQQPREQRRAELRALVARNGKTQAEGVTRVAAILHVSEPTIYAWLKTETAKGSNPTPLWAIELLEFKMKKRRK
jgi:transposase